MNGGAPAISVVIPAFNRCATIMRSVNSVLSQEFLPLEVIVVDDGSEDGTSDLLRAANDRRIRVVSLGARRGAQAARNAGICAAGGEWVAFLDSDDEWLPGKLSRQVEALNSSGGKPFTVVHTDCWRVDHKAGTRTVWNIPPVEGENPYTRMLSSGGPMFQGMLTSKSALEAIGLLDEAVPAYQEWETTIRLARFCRFVHIREPLFIYHCYEGEAISRDSVRAVAGYRYIVEKFREEIISRLGTEAFDAHLRFCALKAMKIDEFTLAETVLGLTSSDTLKTTIVRWLCRLGRGGGRRLARRAAGTMSRRLSIR